MSAAARLLAIGVLATPMGCGLDWTVPVTETDLGGRGHHAPPSSGGSGGSEVSTAATTGSGATSSSSSTSSTGAGTAGVGAGGAAAQQCDGVGSCNDCVTCAENGLCSQEDSDCFANQDCIDVDDCMYHCGPADSACLGDCMAKPGAALWEVYAGCIYCDACPTNCSDWAAAGCS